MTKNQTDFIRNDSNAKKTEVQEAQKVAFNHLHTRKLKKKKHEDKDK